MRHHIYLACVKISFVDREGETGVTETNAMIRSARQQIGVELLARAQQGAQITLMQKLNDPTLNILDAVFTGMFYLGHMTEEEFNKRTPVTARQPDPGAAPNIFDQGSPTGVQDN